MNRDADTRKVIEELFAQALELPPGQRAAYLDSVCAGDFALRAEIDSLLSAHGAASAADYLGERAAPPLLGHLRAAAFVQPRRMVGPYEIIERLGEGGMGVVWRAWDTRLERTIALKFLPWHRGASETARERFLVEARAIAALDHVNICTVYDIGEADAGELFIAMACYEGETLDRKLVRGPLPVGEALHITRQILAALAHAHERGIVHRDVKPANIMVTTDGVAKLLDFGIAKLADVMLTATGSQVGTAAYMSPEQVRGERVDQRADLWAAGVVLYELLAGVRPFAGDTREALLHAITTGAPRPLPAASAALEAAIQRALARIPEERPASARAFALELERIASDSLEDSGTPISRQPYRVVRPRTRVLLAAGILALGGVAWVALTSELPPMRGAMERSAETRSAKPITNNAQALEAYQRAVFYMTEVGDGRSGTPREHAGIAITLLQEAIALDSGFALAYARLARAYNITQFGGVAAEAPRDARERAYLAVQKALALDSTLAEAYAARGDMVWTLSFNFPHERAATDYRHAIALDPELPWAHQSLGSLYMHVGLFERALAQFDTVLILEPTYFAARMRIARVHLYQNDYQRALHEFEAVPEFEVSWQNAIALHYLGRAAEALSHIERLSQRFPKDADVASAYAIVLAAAGRAAAAEEQIQSAIANGSGNSHFHHSAYNIASAYALMGDHTRALEWLRRTAEEGMPCYPLFRDDTNLRALRGRPEFEGFLREMKQRWERYGKVL